MTTRAYNHPPTKRESVVETLHGQEIRDDYRWLEDDASAEVSAWVAAQSEHTRRVLDAVAGRAALETRMRQLIAIGTLGTPEVRGERHFYTRREGEQNQPALYVRDGADGPDRVLLDPNTAHAQATIALDWWYPSADGKLLAYGYSEHGDEKSTLYVLEVDSGKRLTEQIPHTRYSSLAWQPDSSGFYYTRYPKPGEVPAGEENYNQHLFHHSLGNDWRNDPKLFGAGREMTEQVDVSLSPDGRWLLVMAFIGWAQSSLYVRDLSQSDSQFVPIVEGVDAIFYGEMLHDHLYMMTNAGAPHYRVMDVDLNRPQRENWREIIAERDDTIIVGLSIVGERLIVDELREVSSSVSVHQLSGERVDSIALPSLGSVTALGGEWNGAAVYVGYESYTTPPTVYRYQLEGGELKVWAKVDAPVDTSQFEVRQALYNSKDGTPIPMFIVAPRGIKLDGDNPTVLSGYGGFNISRTPLFTRTILAWLERGGVYAVANLRGGGEFGEGWHRAGMLEKKQNVFDDFIAAAEYLIDAGYTNPERLAIEGRSNGGLLVGAAVTQRPELFRAVVCGVPLLDMLRYHLFRIARLWVPEYGSAEDPAQFAYLHAYSPYHQIRPGTRYPAVLLYAAVSDSRVDPLHARKMAAALQAASASDYPILLRMEDEAGHGIGKPLYKQVAEYADTWTFLCDQLNVPLDGSAEV
jgi:prolyl oligopeptidase